MKRNILTLAVSLFLISYSFSQNLNLYGGDNHDVFLGCLNCDSYSSNSIWNQYGSYGSKYNSNSIWNEYGTYGSEYSSKSPWNDNASSPPVVVDKDGNFYGYLTTNEYKGKRAEFSLALTLYKFHDLIKDDVGKWYKKLFE